MVCSCLWYLSSSVSFLVSTMPKTSVRVLRILMLISAAVSLVAQAISLCSNSWLYSEEQMPNPRYNGTGEGDKEYLSKFTTSGLWKLCFNKPGDTSIHCFYIDYFPKEEYSPDPNDSTMAIPYAVKNAASFIFISSIILILGVVLCFLGRILYRRPVLTFASGIAFILSVIFDIALQANPGDVNTEQDLIGLFILAGMVIYISTFKSEVGNKLRPKSSFQGPLFVYRYGYSFRLAVVALMMCEIAGTFAIFLYIQWYKEDNKKQIERQKYADFTPVTDHTHCQRHWGKQNNYRPREQNHDMSPRPSTSRGRRNTNVGLAQSESMRDLAYYSFPPFSRDTTCNTVSTAADREYSREFSFETLRRTTPV